MFKNSTMNIKKKTKNIDQNPLKCPLFYAINKKIKIT